MALEPLYTPKAPSPDLGGRIGLLLPQYDNAAKLKRMIQGMIDMVDEEVAAVLLRLDRGYNDDVSEGAVLDWIGARIGITRPTVPSDSAIYFGFEGTGDNAGRTFDQAPFYDAQRGIEQVEPIGDATYRRILKARARRLRGGANRETIEAILAILFPGGRGYVDESGRPVLLKVAVPDDRYYRLVADVLKERLIPRPAGIAVEFERSEPVPGGDGFFRWGTDRFLWGTDKFTWE